MDPANEAAWRELGQILEAEVAGLPERLRAPLLLCYWEGLTNEEAARSLGWPVGTVKSRLTKGRSLLHRRLSARGVSLPAGAIALMLAPAGAAKAAVPVLLVSATERAVSGAANGTGVVGAEVHALVREASAMAPCVRLKFAALAALVVGAAALGAGLFCLPVPDDTPKAQAKKPDAPTPPAPADRPREPLPDGSLARLGTTRLRTTASVLMPTSDGKTLLTVAGGRTLGRWDVEAGRLLAETHLPGPATNRSWLSPDGSILVVPEDGGLSVWDTASGQRKGLIPVNDKSAMTHVAFAPDGRTLATAEFVSNNDGTGKGYVRVWPIEGGKGRLLAELPSYAHAVTFGPEGKRLYAAVTNHSLRCWDTLSAKQLWQNDHWAENLAVSPDGKTLAADSYLGGPLHLFDADTGKSLFTLGKEKFYTSQIVFAPNGKFVAQAGGKETLLWETAGGRLRHRLESAGWRVAFAPDGKSFFTLGSLLLRWDVESGKELYADVRADGHIGAVTTVTFAPDGRSLASCGADASVRIWSLTDARHRVLRSDAPEGGARHVGAASNLHAFTASPLAFTPDGRWLLTDVAAGTLALTEVATGKEARRFLLPAPKDGWVMTAAASFSGDGRTLFALGQTGLMQTSGSDLRTLEPVRGWDVGTGREVLSRSAPIGAWGGAALSPVGRTLVLPYSGKLFDLKSGKEMGLAKEAKATRSPAVFSPDGRLLVVAEADEEVGPASGVRVYEVLTGRVLVRIKAPLGYGVALGFSPDGRLLAASGTDALHIWDSTTGKRLLHLAARGRLTNWTPAGFATCLAFAPNGRSLATGHADGTILVWDAFPAVKALAAPAGPVDTMACWDDLANDDPSRAFAAIGRLASDPERTIPWLRTHLMRVEVDPRWLATKLADLDSVEFETREVASRELGRVAGDIESLLRRERERAKSAEVRRRLEEVLKMLEEAPAVPPAADEARRLRAVAVLERVGAIEAREMLRALAAGAPDARLTQEAGEAMRRLERRPGAQP